ncbi:MAG TPA: class I SAM-dependent methyltransferase, partial [Steroidobacteraceae bacterium]|nr:class I SAM-dependent methyltransferase [Steroidobacteraceae bacterium]
MNTPQYCMNALDDTRAAFDSVAADYDGPRGNNALIQDMRREMWRWLDASFPSESHLLDLGCGTGLDAVRMAERGHRIVAVDWSPRMVERTQGRAAAARVSDRVRTAAVGGHELELIEGSSIFDGVYSNLGPLNCLPDLAPVSRECARLVKSGGRLVFTVIGRWCPWEIACHASRADWARISVRFARGLTPVRMN